MITLLTAFFWQILLFMRVDRFIWEDGVVEPWFISKGLMFDKDFYSTYLPFPKILMIPINVLSNWNLGATVFVGLLLALSTIYLIYRLSENKTIAVFFFSMFYMFILAQNTFDINLWLGFLLLLAVAIYFRWLKKPTRRNGILFGVISAANFFSTQHTIIPTGAIFLFMWGYLVYKKRSLTDIARLLILPVAVGALLIIVPILSWYGYKNAIFDLYFWSFNYYFRDTGYPFTKFGFSSRDIVLILVFSIPTFMFGFYSKTVKKDQVKLISLWLIVVLSTMYSLFSLFHPRRLLFILPLESVLVGYLPGLIKQGGKKLKVITILLTGVVLVYLITNIAPWYIGKIVRGTKVDYYNHVQVGDPDYLAIEWIKQNSDSASTLNVFSGNTLNYFEAQRLPANQRTYSIPWVYEPFEETKLLLTEKPADYWIVDERLFDRFISWGYPHQVLFIKGLIREKYSKMASFDYMSVYKLSKRP